MCDIIRIPVEAIFWFAMDDLPDVDHNPKFTEEFQEAIGINRPESKRKPPKLTLVKK